MVDTQKVNNDAGPSWPKFANDNESFKRPQYLAWPKTKNSGLTINNNVLNSTWILWISEFDLI